jgi:hypothetical protein
MFNRENAIGLILLLFCAAVAVILLYGIATGTRLHWEGPAWAGPALLIVFLGASIWSYASRPGRRWPWQRQEDRQD